MSRSMRLGCAAVLAALAGAGCGSKDATAPYSGVRLSEAATLEIAYVLMAEMFAIDFGVNGGAPPGEGMSAARVRLFNVQPTQAISVTAPCELGGSIRLEGTITDEVDDQGTGRFSMDLRETPNDCAVSTTEGQFTINGDPNLRITVDLTAPADVELSDIAMSIGGGFRWSGQPGSGSCSVDVTFVIKLAEPEASTVSGKVCGYDVSA